VGLFVRAVGSHAVEALPRGSHGGEEWHDLRRESVAASEVAALVGLSPYVDVFDLWWHKRTGADSQPESAAMRRGTRLETAIILDFADRHEELEVQLPGLCRSLDRPWQVCSPDGVAFEAGPTYAEEEREPVAVVEAKTDAGGGGWGEDGSDEVPLHYRVQALWQMDVIGVNVAYFPVWRGFGYREYLVEYHEGDVLILRAAAEEFLASVREDRQPDVTAHKATGRRLRRLHPSVIDGEVEIPATLQRQYLAAARLKKAAEERQALAEHRIRQAMGDYRVATVNGAKAFSRSVYDVKERVQTVSAHTVHRLNPTKPREWK
jgi:putative phage-type endonuclease